MFHYRFLLAGKKKSRLTMKQWIGCPKTNKSRSFAGSHSHFTNFTVCLCRCVTTLTCLSARKHVLHSTCPSSPTPCLSSFTVRASSTHITTARTSKLYRTNTSKMNFLLYFFEGAQINCKFAVEWVQFSARLCTFTDLKRDPYPSFRYLLVGWTRWDYCS